MNFQYQHFPINIKSIIHCVKLILINKSPVRIFHNYFLKNIEIKNKTIDLGCGHHSSYLNFLKKDNVEIFYADKEIKKEKNYFIVDLEKKINLPDNTFDTVILFNVLEHITNYKDLNTRADINYNKHTAQNKYETGVRASSSTTRSNYSITAKENISDISLDAYVAPTIDAYTSQVPVENANINDDFFSYYHNCYGEPKIEISANLINPKFFNLDIGDIVDFSNMYPKKIFAKSFTNVAFMITSVTRTLGVLKFKAREVGVIS